MPYITHVLRGSDLYYCRNLDLGELPTHQLFGPEMLSYSWKTDISPCSKSVQLFESFKSHCKMFIVFPLVITETRTSSVILTVLVTTLKMSEILLWNVQYLCNTYYSSINRRVLRKLSIVLIRGPTVFGRIPNLCQAWTKLWLHAANYARTYALPPVMGVILSLHSHLNGSNLHLTILPPDWYRASAPIHQFLNRRYYSYVFRMIQFFPNWF